MRPAAADRGAIRRLQEPIQWKRSDAEPGWSGGKATAHTGPMRRNDRPNPGGHEAVLFKVGLLTHHPSASLTAFSSATRTMALSKKGATGATDSKSQAAHSGRTVPESHRSSLFMDAAVAKSITFNAGQCSEQNQPVNQSMLKTRLSFPARNRCENRLRTADCRLTVAGPSVADCSATVAFGTLRSTERSGTLETQRSANRLPSAASSTLAAFPASPG